MMSLFSFNPLQLRHRRLSLESQDQDGPPKSSETDTGTMKGIEPGSKCSVIKRRWGWTREMSWRLTSGFMGLFFLLAAAVQHNDPDPYLWMPAYIVPCVISWVVTLAYAQVIGMDEDRIRKKPCKTENGQGATKGPLTSCPITQWILSKLDMVILLHVLYCFLLGGWTLSVCFLGIQENMDVPGHSSNEGMMKDEEAKELLGLCLIIAWLSLLKNGNFLHLGGLGLGLGAALTLTPFISWILIAIWEKEMPTC